MISASAFLGPAAEHGHTFFTGVPCSFLTPLINRVLGDPKLRYVGAASEGEAVAIAAGAWLAGRRAVVMCQNSGLGNAVNPLTSLNAPFRIPVLLIVTWRGQPGLTDEPQHALMGEITHALLETMQITHRPFPREEAEVLPTLAAVDEEQGRRGLPVALVMERDSVRDDGLEVRPPLLRPAGERRDLRARPPALPSRVEVLERLLARVPLSAAVIASTGKCGRELFTLSDRFQHLYQVGSMGCAAAMGLGVALHVPADQRVVVLDGDGAALMKLGSFATVGAHAPPNLIHVVLDNGVHDSTGGQPTVSPSVAFADVALACGYATGTSCDTLGGFEMAFVAALAEDGPHLIHARIRPGSLARLGRPTVRPDEVARRFQRFLAASRERVR